MSESARSVLASFDALPPADQAALAAELLRRADAYGPLTDEALTEVAAELWSTYDAEEAARAAEV